jgi:hypothetical protein
MVPSSWFLVLGGVEDGEWGELIMDAYGTLMGVSWVLGRHMRMQSEKC